MLTIISCAKMFRKSSELSQLSADKESTQARFAEQSQHIKESLLKCPIESLMKQLKIKEPQAKMLLEQLRNDESGSRYPALLAYHGVAFKSLAAEAFSPSEWERAQSQLRICSFLHGLLRPSDAISPYRLEGKFQLESGSVFQYWRESLTQSLIEEAQAQGGVLCHLASKEMQQLFDWKRLCADLKLITPEFLIEEKGKRRLCSVRSKQARGSMARCIIRQGWQEPEQLCQWGKDEGYVLAEHEPTRLLFVNNID